MAQPLRAVARLVATSQSKPLVAGGNSGVRRLYETASDTSRYVDAERKRGSLYHLIWKRKFTWIICIGGMGSLLYEVFHPDKANRTEALKNHWAHLSGGAYEATKPQKENRVSKE